MNYDNILLEIEDNVALLQINRPRKLNALNRATISELHEALTDLEADTDVKVIILIGEGPKAFVAGADIAEFSNFNEQEGQELSAGGQKKLFDLVEQLKTPVIAAINGFALGGGLELAMSCHFRIASENAKMGLPEVSLGVIPGYGGTQRLPILVGRGRAMELILTGKMIDAGRALEIGLVNHVTSQEELIGLARKLAAQIAKNSPVAIAYAIKAINAGFSSKKPGFQAEIEAFGRCFGTEDFKEGTTAFLEKRPPDFPGF